jgi:hypothetical protein
MSNLNFSHDGNNTSSIPKIDPPDTELFGEFQNFTKSAQIQQSNQNQDFLQLNKRLDDIVYQIGLLKSEVKEMKQLLNINQQYPGTPRPNIYHGTSSSGYPLIPSYPGQPMPPYPYQQQNRYNCHLNSFQSNS